MLDTAGVLGLIVALLAIMAQTGAMFFWGGKLTSDVKHLKEHDQRHEDRLDAVEEHVTQLDRREHGRRTSESR